MVAGPDEAEIRALAGTGGTGPGTGSTLLRAVIERAARQGVRHLVLLTQPEMAAAQHLYERGASAGFPTATGLRSGVTLLAYGLALNSDGPAGRPG